MSISSEIPTSKFRRRRHKVVAALAVVATVVATLAATVLPGSAESAQAATNNSCSYGTGGTAAAGLCWLDFTGYNDATARGAGQQFTETIPGGYTLSFTLTRTTTNTSATVSAHTVPTWDGTPFGNPSGGQYVGLSGNPALYATGVFPAGAGGNWTVSLSSLQITDSAGKVMTGWTLDAADAESTNAGEQLAFNTNGGGWKVVNSIPPVGGTGDAACQGNPGGVGTQTLSCLGNSVSHGAVGDIVASTSGSPSTVSATATEPTTNQGQQGVAFAVSTANLTTNKTVASRVNTTDQFTVSTTDQAGTQAGTATTAGTGTTATTGSKTVLAGSAYTLGEIGSATANLANYSQSWSCSNATSGSTTALPSTGATGTSQVITPQAADNISCTVTNTPPPAALSLVKSASPSGPSAFTAGQLITYSFLLTNTGGVTLNNLAVADTSFSGTGALSGITCPVTTLAPAASTTCTATYTLTTADVNSGSVTNTATAAGNTPEGAPISSNPSSARIPVAANPQLSLVKTATPATIAAPGDLVTYSFLVTNTGNVTLTNAGVNETAFSGSGTAPVVACPAGATSLLPGASVTCTATYTATQADVNAGQITNTATASGTPPSGPPATSPPSSATVTARQSPAITVVKSATPSSPAAYTAGQAISYSFLVTNTGNVTLTDVAVDEADFTGSGTTPAITCPAGAASLAPGAQVTCTATYALTQADIDRGTTTNTATATGTPPSGTPPVSPPSTATVPATPAPAITVVKSADSTNITSAGQHVTYSFLVTNTGNVTLTNATVDEGAFSGTGSLSAVTCPAGAASMIPGASVTCTATYTTTQADVDSGTLTNTATATGTPPSGPAPVSPPSTVVIPTTSAPAITLVKSATPSTIAAAGDQIAYSFLVTNSGNVTLTGVGVNETAFSGTGTVSAISCPAGAASLAPGDSVTCTATYGTTQADVNAGQITNTATATGAPPSGSAVTSDPSTAIVSAAQAPAIALVKSATPTTIAAAGDQVAYSFLVTNTGNVTLSNVGITETAFSGTGAAPVITCPAGAASLDPGAEVTCTASYTATQADVDAGQITNTATTTGTPPSGVAVTSDPSSAIVSATPSPAIALVKSADSTSIAAAGQPIIYSFLVTNTGNVTLTDVTVNEGAFSGTDTLSAVTCPAGAASLEPGASVTCTGTYTTTQADVDSGALANTATATGTPPSGTHPVSPPSTVVIPSTPAPAIALVKSATPATIAAVGDQVTYSFLITNTGNVTLTDAAITETAFSGTGTAPAVTCPAGAASLAPGASVTCTATYTSTQADVDAGQVTNTATAAGTSPAGGPVTSDPSSAIVTATPASAITVVKSATPATITAAGDPVAYSFLVTNTGNVTLDDVTVDEGAFSGTGTLSAVSCPAGAASLAPGVSVTCTATYTATQADVDAGGLTNTATATGTPPSGTPPVSPPSTATIPANSAPAIALVKSATPTTIAAAGDQVAYSFLVTNTGTVTLTGAAITETAFSGTGTPPAITCPADADSLAPGASATCSATYTATQADVDAGQITNTATASGTPPSGPSVTSDPSSAIVAVAQSPSITVLKSATPSTIAAAGDVVTYSFLVTNTGDVSLTDADVNETAFSGTGAPPVVTCPADAASMAPGASTTCTATYTATQDDVDAGLITNTATASGTPPAGPQVTSPPSSATVTATQSPAVSVVKSADTASISAAGQEVTYSFLVTNTGTVTLTNVTVDEGAFSGTGSLSAVMCPAGAASLQPGASVTCTATYTATQADVDADSLTNTATATGTPPSGAPPVSPPSTLIIPVDQAPGIALVKSATPTTIATAGDQVAYSFLVTNTGNVTLTDAGITETAFSGTGTAPTITCPVAAASLAPGASATCTATYTATQADVDAGEITNTATSSGTPPTGSAVTSDPSSAIVTATQAPAIAVVKSATPTTIGAAGDVVAYSFLVTNTGDVTLTDVGITETAFSGAGAVPAIACPAAAASLAPGVSLTCTATYTATQADVDAGAITNTATASGTPPSGSPVTSDPSSAIVTAVQSPAITVAKSASPSDAAHFVVGQVITYSFLVTNTGDVTLTNVAPTDMGFTGSGSLSTIVCPAGAASLAPAASVTCTATYTITQADVDAGQITNDATATGTPPSGPAPVSPPSTTIIPSDQNPALSLVKTADLTQITAAGQAINYSFQVTNTGNVTLTDVSVDEIAFTGSGAAPIVTCPAGAASLAPGAQVTCTGSYTTTQADLDAGGVTNTATASGTPPSGPPTASQPSTVTVPAASAPGITLVKSATPTTVAAVGDQVTYSFLATNTGNVTLADVTIDDTAFSGTGAAPTVTCPAGAVSVAPGASVTCTATYTATQSDVDAGQVTNTATAMGTPPTGGPAISDPSSAIVTATESPAITVVKSANPSDAAHFTVGQVITYSFLITNTGNVTLADVAPTDTGFTGSGTLSAIACPAEAASLAPAAQVTCTATYTITQADVDAGSITNDATATGTPPSGPSPVSPPSTTIIPSDQAPAITVVKSADQTTVTAAGQQITYSFLVTNTGNVTLTGTSVNEGAFTGSGTLSPVTCPSGAALLAPGASVTCTATYTVTQADIDAGSLTNTATATGTPPSGPPTTSPPSTSTVTASAAPSIALAKTATPGTVTQAGDVVTYSFAVTNTGNVTLTDVSATESTFSGTGPLSIIACPAGAASLAPAATVTCTATYSVTQADIDAGQITNTATATGNPPMGAPVISDPSSAVVTATPAPAMTIVKSASPSDQAHYTVGQQITYSFVVTNAGNVTLTNVTVDEGAFTGAGALSAVTCPAGAASLAPGAQVTCTATYTITQADVDGGQITNEATATGTPPSGPPSTSPPSTAVVPTPQNPAITVTKTANRATITAPGQMITYSFLVTNTGNVTLTNPTVQEGSFNGAGSLSAVTCPSAIVSLSPGESVTCTASYTVLAADLTGKTLTNTATVAADSPGDTPIVSPPSTARTTTPQGSAVETGGYVLTPVGASFGWVWSLLAGLGMSLAVTAVVVASRRRRRNEHS